MHDGSDRRFTFTLGALPSEDFVKLSEALELAFFGGVLKVKDEGPVPVSAIENGAHSIEGGEWVSHTDYGRLRDPRYVLLAEPGAVLFGI
jgi:hypothetical protein